MNHFPTNNQLSYPSSASSATTTEEESSDNDVTEPHTATHPAPFISQQSNFFEELDEEPSEAPTPTALTPFSLHSQSHHSTNMNTSTAPITTLKTTSSRPALLRNFSFKSLSTTMRSKPHTRQIGDPTKCTTVSVNPKQLHLKVNQYLGAVDPYLLQQMSYSRAGWNRAGSESRHRTHSHHNAQEAKSSNVVNGHEERVKESDDAQDSVQLREKRKKRTKTSSAVVQWIQHKNPFKTELNDDIDQRLKSSNEWHLHGKTFFIFSPRSRMRRLGLAIMKNPLLLFISAFLTVLNLVWFVLERTPSFVFIDFLHDVLPYYNYYLYAYLGLYVLELGFRMLILGIFTGENSFFRNNWNLFEFVILLASFIFLNWMNLSVLRILIIFRFFEGLALFNSLTAIYASIWGALPRLRGVFLFMIFVLYMFAVTGVDFFRRNLTKRCGLEQPDGSFLPAVPEQWCSTNNFGFQCPGDLVCRADQSNPNFGLSSFDTIASSLLLTFQILSTSNWSLYYYMVSNTEFFVIAFIWMFSLILLVSFVVLNLVVVAIDSVFDVLRYYAALNKQNRIRGRGVIMERALYALPSAVFLYIERTLFFRKPRKIHRRLSPLLCFPRTLLRFMVDNILWDCAVMIVIISNVVVEVLFSYSLIDSTHMDLVNWIFSGVFIGEILLSMFALGPLTYLKNNFHKLDFVVVLLNLILTVITPPGSVFENIGTQLRLFRIFSIISRLPYFRKIIAQTFAALLSLLNVVIFVTVVIYGFAVVGNQLFETVNSDRSGPNFSDITNSMLSLFKILTGDTWEVQMYAITGQNQYLLAKYLAIPYFLIYLILAKYVLMSMFTVVVLEAFSNADEASGDETSLFTLRRWNPLKLVFNPRAKSDDATRDNMYKTTTVQIMDYEPVLTQGNAPSARVGTKAVHHKLVQEQLTVNKDTADNASHTHQRTTSAMGTTTFGRGPYPLQRMDSILTKDSVEPTTDSAENFADIVKEPANPEKTRPRKDRIFFIPFTSPLRHKLNQLVESTIFQHIMMAIILAASLSLLLEEAPDKSNTQNSTLRTIILGLDIFYFSAFTVEVGLKFLAKGIKLFLKDPLTTLDLILIAELGVSIAFFFVDSRSISDVRSYIRLVRALRPIRLILKLPDLRIYMRAMRSGLKSFALVCGVAILVLSTFAIICTRLFAGSHLYCTDPRITSLNACDGYFTNRLGITSARSVRNKPANFDNLLQSIFTLLEVTSLSNWSSIIWPTLTSDYKGFFSEKRFRIEISLVFVVFIVAMVFFSLNLFVGVLISEIKLQRNNQSALTPRQKYWAHLKRQIMLLRPERRILPPRLICFRVIYWIVSSKLWNFVIGIMIFATTIIFASQFSSQPETYGYVLDGIVAFVMLVLMLEVVLKILSYGVRLYFSSWWHVLYATILSGMLIAIVVCLIVEGLNYEPIRLSMKVASRLLLLIRIIKIAMVFQSVRFMLETLYSAIPSLLNTFLVLFLVFLSYALIGLQLFSQVKYQSFIGINMNYRSMPKGLITLLRVLTLENWNGLMYDAAIQAPECTEGIDCGNKYAAWAFYFSFFILAAHVLLSLLLGIVLDFFSHSFSSIPRSIKEKSIKQYVHLWKKYDPKATGRITFENFAKLNDELVLFGNELGLDRSKRIANDKYLLSLLEFREGVKFTAEELAQFSFRLGIVQNLKNALKMGCLCRCFSNRNKQAEKGEKSDKHIMFNLCLIVLCRNKLEPEDRTPQETKARSKFLAKSVQELAAIKIQRFYKVHMKSVKTQDQMRSLVQMATTEHKEKGLLTRDGSAASTFEVTVRDPNGRSSLPTENEASNEPTVEDFARMFFSNL